MIPAHNFLFLDDLFATFAACPTPSDGGGRRARKKDVGR